MLGVASEARAAADTGPWLGALSSSYVVTDLSTGDIDGDGKDETVVCYREDTGRTQQTSGVALYAGKGPELRPLWHVQLETLCEKARIQKGKLGVLLQGNKQLVLNLGEQVKLRSDKGSLYGALTARSSSTSDTSHGAEKALDGDLATSWAEGKSGTGIGQSVTVKLPRAMDIGAIAIYGGNGNGSRAYFDSNRIHRGSIEAKTDADLGDSAAGLDFASLGIESMGDRTEFNCENKPQVTYVHIGRKGVVELQFRIESVYLGDKKDDTHIAEIEIVPMLSLSETVDKATPLKSGSNGTSSDAARAAAENEKRTQAKAAADEAAKKLDSGGSVINDDL